MVLRFEEDVNDLHGGDVFSLDGNYTANLGVCLCKEAVAGNRGLCSKSRTSE